MRILYCLMTAMLLAAPASRGGAIGQEVNLPKTPPANASPEHYLCFRGESITVDGKLDEASWSKARWTNDFVDIEGSTRPRPRFRTRAKMLWDDSYFYIAAALDEPHVWATITKRDSVIFHDNDFELFIDPDSDNHWYAEFEMNALNTGWDLRLTKPYRDGGQVDDGWQIDGIKTAVHVLGTLNDPADQDAGWTLEIAIPWSMAASLHDSTAPIRRAIRNGSVLDSYEDVSRNPVDDEALPRPVAVPPRDGDQWRVNFSRVEWEHEIVEGKYRRVPHSKEDNWVWSPQGAINMHRPETWGYVQFSHAAAGTPAAEAVPFRPDPAAKAKQILHTIYEGQRDYFKAHERYAASIDQLDIKLATDGSVIEPPRIELRDPGYRAVVRVREPGGNITEWQIRHDSLLRRR